MAVFGLHRGLLASVAMGVCLSVSSLGGSALAQDLAGLVETDPNAQLLLQADELIYNNDNETVSAVGNVRIDYDGNRVVAERVTYNQRTARLVAVGNVEILQPDGTRITADEIDITDDFADGFVNGLRAVTPDNTRFGAESGERRDGNLTILNNGFYTACEACEKNPDRPVLWQIKAEKIIWNGEEKTVRFENASFEFLGIPLARLPVFTTADPTVRRKTGFLAPTFGYSEELGFKTSIPYFIVLAPNADLRLTTTGYTRQGFLGEAEFRHRLENGTYTLKIAGIHQFTPEAFDAGTVDRAEDNRGMIGTTGNFRINPRWSFGWDVMVQSDDNFANTYSISGFNQSTRRDSIYLTGLGSRSYFNAELLHFDRQESNARATNDTEQPFVLPTVDYNYIVDRDVAGGQLAFNANMRVISREAENLETGGGFTSVRGVEGETLRTTLQAEWKRDFVTMGGLVLTPLLHAQGDISWQDSTTTAASYSKGALTSDDTVFRGMVTAGLEARWPILFSTSSATHVLEPMAQVFVRPDEMHAGTLPNEDAQSFVFDASNLFARDKFSGFDRIEGGTRANVGIRYNGSFANGFGLNALFGQSYHLAGDNPFASPDLANVGVLSGLESDVSDFVGAFGINYSGEAIGNQASLSLVAGARFDKDDFEVKRADLDLSYSDPVVGAQVGYSYIAAQPGYGFTTDRQEIRASGSLKLHENWTLRASAAYDLENNRVTSNSIGLRYDDECFVFGVNYTEDRLNQSVIKRDVGFRLSFRTLGDFGSNASDF